MTFQLQSQSPLLPPDYKKQIDAAVRQTRTALDEGFAMVEEGQPDNALLQGFLAVLQRIEAGLDTVETGAHHVHANADEMKAAIGRVRAQRDEAIKARNETLAYLRQRKKNP
jgi:hypothetical protein